MHLDALVNPVLMDDNSDETYNNLIKSFQTSLSPNDLLLMKVPLYLRAVFGDYRK